MCKVIRIDIPLLLINIIERIIVIVVEYIMPCQRDLIINCEEMLFYTYTLEMIYTRRRGVFLFRHSSPDERTGPFGSNKKQIIAKTAFINNG